MNSAKADKWELDNYEAVKADAAREEPPSRITLYLGALDTLRTKDRSFVDKSIDIVRGNVPRDICLQIYGAALFDSGFQEEGLAALRKAVEANRTRENILITAWRLNEGNHRSEALALYDELVAKDANNDVEAILGRAAILPHTNHWREAHECFARVLSISRKCGPAHLGLAEAEIERRNYKLGFKHAKKALQFGCAFPGDAWYVIGLCEVHRERFRKARRAAKRCLEIDPDNEEIRWLIEELDDNGNYGQCLFEYDRDEEAYPWLVLEAKRERPPGLANLYLASLKTKRTTNVQFIEDATNKTAATLPEDLILQVSGMTAFQIGLKEKGITEMRRAVQLSPSARNKICLAANLTEIGERTEAASLCKEVLAAEPDNPGALFYLAYANEDPQQALVLYKAARDADPEVPTSQYQVGYAFETLGRFEEALREYEAALSLDPPQPAIVWRAVGYCHYQLGNFAGALECAREALWYDDSYELAAELLEQAKNSGILSPEFGGGWPRKDSL